MIQLCTQVSVTDARKTVNLWYNDRKEVLKWQEERKAQAAREQLVYTLLGRARRFPPISKATNAQKGHIERAAINTPVQVLVFLSTCSHSWVYFFCHPIIVYVFNESLIYTNLFINNVLNSISVWIFVDFLFNKKN